MIIAPVQGSFVVKCDSAGTTAVVTFQATHYKQDGSTEIVSIEFYTSTDADQVYAHAQKAMQQYLEGINAGIPRDVSIAVVLNSMSQAECNTRGL